MKVLFLTNVPSPYRVDFFNELGKTYDLTVVFEKNTSDERDKSWQEYSFNRFKGVILKGISLKTDAALCPGIINYVKDKSFQVIICTNISSPTGIFAMQYMQNHKIPYIIEGDGGFAKNGKGLIERIKRHYISKAAYCLSTGKSLDEYYMKYGAKNNIIRYPFSSLRAADIMDKPATSEEKRRLRDELNIKEPKIILAVGQFIQRKGFDILMRAVKNIGDDVGIYFVGGIPTDEYLSLQKELSLKNVHYVGFKSKKDLSKYYRASDLFVLPTREDIWGLVVNEAMGNGLPVISTDRCGAALEMIQDGINGYTFPVDDTEALYARISELINDNQKIINFGEQSLQISRSYSIEKMVESHINIIEKIIKKR